MNNGRVSLYNCTISQNWYILWLCVFSFIHMECLIANMDRIRYNCGMKQSRSIQLLKCRTFYSYTKYKTQNTIHSFSFNHWILACNYIHSFHRLVRFGWDFFISNWSKTACFHNIFIFVYGVARDFFNDTCFSFWISCEGVNNNT